MNLSDYVEIVPSVNSSRLKEEGGTEVKIYGTDKTVYITDNIKRYVLKKGDILIPRNIGDKTDNIVVYDKDDEYIAINSYIVLRPRDVKLSQLLKWYIAKNINRFTEGVVTKRVDVRGLLQMEILENLDPKKSLLIKENEELKRLYDKKVELLEKKVDVILHKGEFE